MLMSIESYVAEEYERAEGVAHLAGIDAIQVFDGDGGMTLKQFPVAGAAPTGCRPYAFVDVDSASVTTADGACLARTPVQPDALDAIRAEAAVYQISVFYRRVFSGHEDGFVKGGEETRFDIRNEMIIAEGDRFKGVLLNWIGCGEGSWWNGINQCVLLADGTTTGTVCGTYGFDFDDSAYYGKDSWFVELTRK